MIFKRKPIIEVSALQQNIGYFKAPDSSKKFLPEWIKKVKFNLPKKDTNENLYPGQTVRACMPFMDAMSLGWVMPVPFDIYFEVSDYGKHVNYEYRNKINVAENNIAPPIEAHSQEQAGMNNLYANAPILKFVNPWKITTRSGYSTMFINPVNQGKSYIECFAGLVDTDRYNNQINFPFRVLNPDGLEKYNFMIKAGQPIVQFFPVKRKDVYGKMPVRRLTNDDMKDNFYVVSNFHHYKENVHVKKD